MSDSTARPAGTPRWPLAIALALVVALVVGVLIAASLVRNQPLEPLNLAAVPAPAAHSADCSRLLAALPDQLDGGALGALDRRQLRVPAPPGTTAWGEPPVVLRCGLDRPADLTASSRLLGISGVQFLEIPGGGMSTWVAVDRPVYVAVALPPTTGSGPLQQLATVIAHTLPPQGLDLPG
ncbi:MAG TPA: DUF3515 domain-containing protein [Pseudonocardiaceae bacterium]|nr:DUF3515 domain-containing protein [Pseudonocardiaceae bacterium]